MAYSTSSVTNLDDVLGAISTFAGGLGWTIDKRATNLLFLHKGTTSVVMDRITGTVNDFVSGASVAKTETAIRSALVSTINTALTTAFGHSGGPTLATASFTLTNNLTSVNTVWLFSDATGTYIDCVIRCGADMYSHIGFGLMNMKENTLLPPSFLVGSFWNWNQVAAARSEQNCFRSSADGGTNGYHSIPMAGFGGTITYQPSGFTIPAGMFKFQEAPLASGGPQTGTAYYLATDSIALTMPLGFISTNALFYANGPSTTYNTGFSGGVSGDVLTPAGRLITRTIPCFAKSTASQWGPQVFIGEYPGVRYVNLNGVAPEQEVSFGGQTYVCFPVHRKGPIAEFNTTLKNSSSINLGIAYLKVT